MPWLLAVIQCQLVQFSLSGAGKALSDLEIVAQLFEAILGKKAELEITDYSISQTTMETVFMTFAEMQERDEQAPPEQLEGA